MNVYLGELYKEVEYIQSSGTQWIDTGVIPTSNTKSQIKFRNLGVTGEVIYGASVQSSGNTNYRFFNYNSKIYFDLNYPNRINGSTCAVNTDYEFEIGNFYVKNVGASSNLISGNYVSGYTGSISIKLNYSNWNGAISSNRWYYVKIWDGTTLVRDMIPCYRVSDNEIGMFDKVNNKFYANAGTGTFTKGNDVKVFQPELKNAYIGEVYEYSYDFRNKTTTQLSNDGWTWDNTPSIDGNGIYYSSWASYPKRTLPSLTNAKHITIDSQFQVGLSSKWSVGLWLAKNGTGDNGFYADQTPSRQVHLNTTVVSDVRTSIASGTWTSHIEYDLVNKTYSYTGFIEGTGTLTDAMISNIKSDTQLMLIVANPGERFQTIKVLVE